MNINVIVSKKKQEDFTDYMQYYRSDMLNVFVGQRATGKSFSIDKFLSQTEARRDFKIDEYEVAPDGYTLYRHTSETLAIGSRPQKPEIVWFKKGDVISINPILSKNNRHIVDNILEDENVKYIIFIH